MGGESQSRPARFKFQVRFRGLKLLLTFKFDFDVLGRFDLRKDERKFRFKLPEVVRALAWGWPSAGGGFLRAKCPRELP